MNIAGHIAVAARLAPGEPRVWLGAALPDLGAMGRFRLMGDSPDPDITAGIALHHATDDVFHRHPTFTTTMATLRQQLADDGVHRGAARAAAHVGPELMIDGELLRNTDLPQWVDAAFAEIDLVGAGLSPLVLDDHDEWDRHLAKAAGWGLPTDYHDADAVAQRLHRILSRRPRLAMDDASVDHVARRLTDAQPELVAAVPGLIDDLVDELAQRF